ncbi:unnamed protein product [Dovyalis caffra]|uniref:Uncharacterized protein n=1 Tax=Dovyalis caffra TaxID=77055 RepID=A0AAV1SRN7_9ROSI|nr:unnamed protein product [Dovyalis caffra]
MAFTSISSIYIKPPNISTSSSKSPSPSKPFRIAYQLDTEEGNQFPDCCKSGYKVDTPKSKNWIRLVSTALAAAVVSFNSGNLPAVADLNKFEAETRGEFGIGSAAQFGSADLRKAVYVKENFSTPTYTAKVGVPYNQGKKNKMKPKFPFCVFKSPAVPHNLQCKD